MFNQNHAENSQRSISHFLVFANNIQISPLLLNDNSNSFEIYSINSRNELVDCFQSKRPGCLVTTTDDDFLDNTNINLMSRLMPIVMVTNTSSLTVAAKVAKFGAHTVLRNANDPDRVRDAIRAACFADAGHELCPYTMRTRIHKLTSKEKQVIYMSLRGKTTKMVSNELNVCHQTVDKHKKRALSKLRATSVVDLMNMLLDSHRLAAGVTDRLASMPRPSHSHFNLKSSSASADV